MTETGFIYKLCCLDSEIKDIYVGSTKAIRARKCQHKFACLNANSMKHNLRVYQFIRENGNWSNWGMIIIEEYKYNTKHELQSRERCWLETLKATLNSVIPTRTLKEYEDDNRERLTDRRKRYYVKNSEVIIEKVKEYYEINKERIEKHKSQKIICECGSQLRKNDLARHKKTKLHQFYETTYNYIFS